MRIFITGITGQLGYDIALEANKKNYEVYGCGQQEFKTEIFHYLTLDITDKEKIKIIKLINPDVIIHCAAWTNVDLAEDYPKEVENINYLGTKNIAEVAKEINATMIYISTDYIFNLNNTELILPDTAANPINIYGKTKFKGEIAVSSILDKYYIVRTSWVFGEHGKNFIKTILNLSNTKNEINIINDQIGRPTYTKDLAKLLLDMAISNKYGYYHATNEGEYISWYELCNFVFKIKNINIKVNPISSLKYNSKALRPYNSRLDNSKLKENGFNLLPYWEDAVIRYVQNFNNSSNT